LRKLLFSILFISFSWFSAFAQLNEQTDSQVSEGSIYSSLGVGLPVDFGSSSARGMGLNGTSYIEPFVPSLANPAHWGHTVYGMASGDVGITNYSSEDDFGSAKHSNLSISHVQFQLPIYKGKLGVSASFSPYTRAAFETIETGSRTIGSGSAQNTLDFTTETLGSGGISRYEFGVGWKINNTISIGYAASLVSASIDNQVFTNINDTDNSANFAPVNFTLQTSGSGFGNRAGIYLEFPSLISDDDQLSIGTSVTFPVNLDARRTQERVFSANDDDQLEEDENKIAEGTIELPLGINTGLTYKPSDKYGITVEGLFEQWSEYGNELRSTSNTLFTDRLKIGTGLKFYPFVSGSDKFLSQFKYSLGATYDTGHLEVNGEDINTLMFSAGLGLLSPNSNSSIDISLEYGFRGTKSQSLVKEDIWGVNVSLNLAELFFFRPKLQ
jgi:hypothetical protein